MITEFTRQNLKELLADMDAAMKEVAKKHGLSWEGGNWTFYADNVKVKGTFVTAGQDGTVETIAMKDFKKYCVLHGLEKTDLGRTFKIQGKEFTICGWKPKSYKRPILASNGEKTYKFDVDTVKTFLKVAR